MPAWPDGDDSALREVDHAEEENMHHECYNNLSLRLVYVLYTTDYLLANLYVPQQRRLAVSIVDYYCKMSSD